jgi:two-component system response regulator DctR
MTTSSRIALIDDDRAWRETLSDYLGEKGFHVFAAEGARRGLAILAANDIALAIIDFHMPEMSGLELLRYLRRRPRRVTALMVSSDDDPSLAERALAEGARAFLSKTTAPPVLLRTLLQTLSRAAAEPALWLPIAIHRGVFLPAPQHSRDPRRY